MNAYMENQRLNGHAMKSNKIENSIQKSITILRNRIIMRTKEN